MIGVTKKSAAPNRWALSYNFRLALAADTRKMFGIHHDDPYMHNEATPPRIERDISDEDAIKETFQRFNAFTGNGDPTKLQMIATKDVASPAIQSSLLQAGELRLK